MYFFISIGPKIGTSVAPPSNESTEHGLNKSIVHEFNECRDYCTVAQ